MALRRESKAINSQVELATLQNAKATKLALNRERESLNLSRVRVLEDLAQAKNPRYRELLQQSLEFLDEKLAALEGGTFGLGPVSREPGKLVSRKTSPTLERPIGRLRVDTDHNHRKTLKQFASALLERAWLVDSAVVPPFVLTGTLDLKSEEELVDYAAQNGTLECDVSLIVRLEGTRELVMLALYPSGAVRGLPGTIRPSSLGTRLTIENLLATIDPDSDLEGFPSTGLSFSVRILAFDSKQ